MNEIKRWEIRRCMSASEISAVVKFLNKEYGDDLGIAWDEKYIFNKLNLNPNGTGVLLAAFFNNEVISSLSLTMKKIVWGGESILVAEIGDSYTSKYVLKNRNDYICSDIYSGSNKYISQSIFGRLVFEIENEARKLGVEMIYGTPNHRSLPGYTKKLDYLIVDAKKCDVFLKTCVTAELIAQTIRVPAGFFRKVFNVLYLPFMAKDCLLRGRTKRLGIEKITNYLEKEIDQFLIKNIESGELVRSYRWYQCRFMQGDPASKYNGYIYRSKYGEIIGLIYIKLGDKNSLTIADWVIAKNSHDHHLFLEKILLEKNYHSCVVKIWISRNDPINVYLNKLLFFKIKKIDIIKKIIGSKDIDFNKFHISFSDNI